MYNTADSVPRADISTVLMEAIGQEKHYIGQLVMPVYPSASEIGRYPKFTVADSGLMKAGKGYAGSTKRGATGTYNEIERKFVWDSYQTEEYGLEERVDDVVKTRMANFFDAEMITAKLLMNALMLDYEQEVAASIMDPSTFTTTNAVSNWTEANIATMDVPQDINALIERMTTLGEDEGMTLIMSLSVWNRIRRSAKLGTYMYGNLNTTQGGSQITQQMFEQVFNVRVIIAKKSVDTGIMGVAPVLAPVWGNDFVAAMNIRDGDFMTGGVGRTIVWSSDAPGGLFTSEQYRYEPRRGDILRIRSNRSIKVVSSRAGQLIRTGFSS